MLLSLISSPSFATLRMSDGKKAVASAGTAEAIVSTSTPASSLTMCSDTANTGKIVIGSSPVATAGSQEGAILNPGECMSINTSIGTFDVSEVFANATVSGEDVSYFYTLES